ncbi:hypothetical protein CMI48_00905 [Candidatus Pacearchaeota archaeon]|jgi:hypothetical protein|nr:hypothetical protein [Candidatus Pacearchaeota archaeon]|tara:strand:+ start:714 stop:1034 length:321 start_codon:yes stop_codon:yes gene_type:complete
MAEKEERERLPERTWVDHVLGPIPGVGLHRAWRRSKKYNGTMGDHLRTIAQAAYTSVTMALLGHYTHIGLRTGEWNALNQVENILQQKVDELEGHRRNTFIISPIE